MKLSVKLAAALLPLMAASPALADDVKTSDFTLSGGVTLVSQYRYRGVSLSDEDPAIQGTLGLSHSSGLYVGTWSSSLKGFGVLGGSTIEVDLYGGYKKEIAKGVTLDTGIVYYAYPGSKGGDFEFFEPYSNVSFAAGPATIKVGGNYAWKQSALADHDNLYLFGETAIAIPGTPLTLNGHLGRSNGKSALAAGDHYWDWSVGASATYKQFTATLAYVDTDINDSKAYAIGATPNIVSSAIVATIGATF